MEYTEKDCWIWLTLAFGAANSHKWAVLSHYKSVVEACEKITSGDYTYILPNDLRYVRSAGMNQAVKLSKLCEERGIEIATFSDPLFPDRLREIYNPPALLYYRGDISGIDDSVVITAVGTRHPSEYSVNVGSRICSELAGRGVIIASGFAVGLDSVAHRSAIKAGGRTIAVLPCGISYDYPKENADAKETIVAKGGAIISEYPPDAKATTLGFRARNRILSGIGLGTLIIQCAPHGGPLSTASFALSQGKDIFCVPPHDLYDEAYGGVIGLLRDGAKPVFGSEDVINEYIGLYPHKLRAGAEVPKPAMPVSSDGEPSKKRPSKRPAKDKSPEKPDTPPNPAEFSPAAMVYGDPACLFGTKKEIYDFILSHGEVHIDEISLGIPDVAEVEAFVTELELDGLISSLPGNRLKIK